MTSEETLDKGTNSPMPSMTSCKSAELSNVIFTEGAVTTSGAPSYSGNRTVVPGNFQKSVTQFLNVVAYG